MEELGLQDIYRKLHPNTKSFTYETKNLKLKSRIDFFLVSNSIVSEVKRAEIRSSIAPDHKAIFLGIEVRSSLERGPGSWKFNNTLLDDEKYKELIRFIYPQIREKYKDVESKQLLWELIKMEIRAKTIKFSKSKRSEFKKRELTLQTELEELDRKICNRSTNMDLDQDVLKAYDAAKGELKEIYDLRGKEAIFRSRAKWIEEGEKPTKYFFNLEERNYEKKTILQEKLENGETTSDLNKVNKEIERFFSNMFTTKLAGIPLVQQKRSFNSLVEGLELPKLTYEEQVSLEHELSLEEIKKVLVSFEKNKTPGEDGFTVEFYETFFDMPQDDLLNSYNEAFQKGKLSVSQRRGIISLIPKEDNDLSELTSWRTITLLNVDYKILAKTIAKRIEPFLPKLIH